MYILLVNCRLIIFIDLTFHASLYLSSRLLLHTNLFLLDVWKKLVSPGRNGFTHRSVLPFKITAFIALTMDVMLILLRDYGSSFHLLDQMPESVIMTADWLTKVMWGWSDARSAAMVCFLQ